jgi:dUTPase
MNLNKCKCGSYAINPHLHGREKEIDIDLCDVCYWRKRAISKTTKVKDGTMHYNFKKMTPTAKMPTRHTRVSAGVDFYSDEYVRIPSGASAIVSTGISWNPKGLLFCIEGYEYPVGKLKETRLQSEHASVSIIIQSRSGYAFKHGIEASNAGVIDQDYTPHDEEKAIIKVKLYNFSEKEFVVKEGDKICQGIPQLIPFFSDVEDLDVSRNGKGFGSSDKKE